MKFLLVLGSVAWLSVAIAGFVYLTQFKSTAGEHGAAYPAVFPTSSRLATDASLPTLLFFAHPKCPCTRAALNELARLMTDVNGKVTVYVIVLKPAEETDEWAATDLLDAAKKIPNVQVVIDEAEKETHLFDAKTSSLALLYDRNGKLRFDGGITASRGHEGDNAGRTALSEIINNDVGQTGESKVFGCPLHRKDCDGELIQANQ